jgi:hypothetical protein
VPWKEVGAKRAIQIKLIRIPILRGSFLEGVRKRPETIAEPKVAATAAKRRVNPGVQPPKSFELSSLPAPEIAV